MTNKFAKENRAFVPIVAILLIAVAIVAGGILLEKIRPGTISIYGANIVNIHASAFGKTQFAEGNYWKIPVSLTPVDTNILFKLNSGEAYPVDTKSKAVTTFDVSIGFNALDSFSTVPVSERGATIKLDSQNLDTAPIKYHELGTSWLTTYRYFIYAMKGTSTVAEKTVDFNYLKTPPLIALQDPRDPNGKAYIENVGFQSRGLSVPDSEPYMSIQDPNGKWWLFEEDKFLRAIDSWHTTINNAPLGILNLQVQDFWFGHERSYIDEWGDLMVFFSWPGIVSMLIDKKTEMINADPNIRGVEFSTTEVKITHPSAGLSGTFILWIKEELAGTKIEFVGEQIKIPAPKVISVNPSYFDIVETESQQFSASVANHGDEGTIICSGSGNNFVVTLNPTSFTLASGAIKTLSGVIIAQGVDKDTTFNGEVKCFATGGESSQPLTVMIRNRAGDPIARIVNANPGSLETPESTSKNVQLNIKNIGGAGTVKLSGSGNKLSIDFSEKSFTLQKDGTKIITASITALNVDSNFDTIATIKAEAIGGSDSIQIKVKILDAGIPPQPDDKLMKGALIFVGIIVGIFILYLTLTWVGVI